MAARVRREIACGAVLTAGLLAVSCSAPTSAQRSPTHAMRTASTASSPTSPAPVGRGLRGKFSVSSLDFVTGKTGYVTVNGYPGDRNTLYSWFERTTDGGRTWSPTPATRGESSPSSGTTAWVTARDGWSSTVSYATHLPVPALHFTTDAATTWQVEREPFWVSDIAVVDGSSWLIGSAPRCATPVCPDTIYSAARVGGPLIPLPAQPSATANIHALVRTAADKALAVLHGHDGYSVVATTNAGRSWRGRPLPCGAHTVTVAVAAAHDGTVYLSCTGQSKGMCESCGPVTVFRSYDLGNSWLKVPARGTGSVLCCVESLVPTTSSDLWLLQDFPVGPGSVWHSSNNGRTFIRVFGNQNRGPYLDLLTAHARSAWVIANHVTRAGAVFKVSRTIDSGKTWQTVMLPLPAGLPSH